MVNVSIQSYREPKAHNAMSVTLGKLVLYFSYETIIAFNPHDGKPVRVRVNEWGPTTGKHMNIIDGGTKSRFIANEFNDRLNIALANITD